MIAFIVYFIFLQIAGPPCWRYGTYAAMVCLAIGDLRFLSKLIVTPFITYCIIDY